MKNKILIYLFIIIGVFFVGEVEANAAYYKQKCTYINDAQQTVVIAHKEKKWAYYMEFNGAPLNPDNVTLYDVDDWWDGVMDQDCSKYKWVTQLNSSYFNLYTKYPSADNIKRAISGVYRLGDGGSVIVYPYIKHDCDYHIDRNVSGNSFSVDINLNQNLEGKKVATLVKDGVSQDKGSDIWHSDYDKNGLNDLLNERVNKDDAVICPAYAYYIGGSGDNNVEFGNSTSGPKGTQFVISFKEKPDVTARKEQAAKITEITNAIPGIITPLTSCHNGDTLLCNTDEIKAAMDTYEKSFNEKNTLLSDIERVLYAENQSIFNAARVKLNDINDQFDVEYKKLIDLARAKGYDTKILNDLAARAGDVYRRTSRAIENLSATGCGLISPELWTEINNILGYIRILVPVLLIVLGAMDFSKAVMGGDADALKKASSNFTKRLLMGVIIFFLPTLLNLIIGFVNESYGVCDQIG